MINNKGFENKGLSSYNSQSGVGGQGNSGQVGSQSVEMVSKQGIEPKKVASVPVSSMLLENQVDPLSKKAP